MPKSPPEKTKLPIVLRQKWITVMPDGAPLDAGVSYHLSEAHASAATAEAFDRQQLLSTAEPHEEPLGEPEAVHTTPEYYKRIEEAVAQGATGIRVR